MIRQASSLFCFVFVSVALFFPSFCMLQPAHGANVNRTGAARETQFQCGRDSSQWHYFLWEAIPPEWIRDETRSFILRAYQKNRWRPFFFADRFELNRDATNLLQKLAELNQQGIDPAPFKLQELLKQIEELQKLRRSVVCNSSGRPQTVPQHGRKYSSSHVRFPLPRQAPDEDPQTGPSLRSPGLSVPRGAGEPNRAAFEKASSVEIALVEALVRLAREMNPFSTQALVKTLNGESTISEFVENLEPRSPHYRPLIKALAKYRKLTQTHSFRWFNAPKLKLGSHGRSVKRLQKRLAEEGYFSGEVSGVFDMDTHASVQQFQRAHLLTPDGVVGRKTRAELNKPYKRKLQLILESLKLLRKSQCRLFDSYIRINIPQFILEYYQDGRIISTHRVIVGKAKGKQVKIQGRTIGENQTPTLVSAIRRVIFNPRWYVSDRIRMELDEEATEDPDYFGKHGYVEMSSSYPWGAPRIYQQPGPTNPLGRVKFEFPNGYAIFLHDTPKKRLFKKARRDLSHGCIRLDKAIEFARLLLANDQNSSAEKIDRYLSHFRQVYVGLNRPVPIVIEYVPVSSDGNGNVVFCGDPYGWIKGS